MTMDSSEFERLLAVASEELGALQQVMSDSLDTDIELIREVSGHIFAGGKRLRAIVALLSMKECGVPDEMRFRIAASIEMIHCATLLHDDVVDDSMTRRHRDTAKKIFGNSASVLVGDYLYAKASQICARAEQTELTKCFADATRSLAEGEVIQLVKLTEPSYDEKGYFDVIGRKTASLFRLAALSGPLLGGDSSLRDPYATYGWNLGLSFQVIDDALDYAGDAEKTGKKVGKDLEEKKVTLPMIYGMETLEPESRDALREAMSAGEISDSQQATLFEVSSMPGTLQRVRGKAEDLAMRAKRSLLDLPSSREKDLLVDLAGTSVFRSH